MNSSLLFRAAAVLIVLFAVGHTIGFRQVDPTWGLTDALHTLQSTEFRTQGFTRNYWEFYVGFGFFVSVLLLFLAVVAWYIGGVGPASWPTVRALAWATVICLAAIVFLSARFFFAAPIVFSTIILLCLLPGTLLAERRA
jgi:hypothetical protein